MARSLPDGSCDPLPYTQVDRAVKQTAAMIATRLNVSFQHALGGLVQFWELNGDPRELEALLAVGRREVVLDRDEATRRFRVAMGGEMAPEELSSLRLLEPQADGFRVRGMSRYFKPLERRVQARVAASIGGRATAAKAVRGDDGRFRPVPTAGPSLGAPLGGSLGPLLGERLDVSVSGTSNHPSDRQAATKSADSVQRSSLEASFPTSSVETPFHLKPAAVKQAKKKSAQEVLFQKLADARLDHMGDGWVDDRYSAAEVNTFMKHITDRRHPTTGEAYRDTAVLGAFQAFLSNDRFAHQAPPFRIRVFASPSVFSEHLAKFAQTGEAA